MDEFQQVEVEEALAPEEADGWDEPLLADDLEAAYLRALEATEAIEREMDAQEPSVEDVVNPNSNEAETQSGGGCSVFRNWRASSLESESRFVPANFEKPNTRPLAPEGVEIRSDLQPLPDPPVADDSNLLSQSESAPTHTASSAMRPVTKPTVDSAPRVSEKQVVEAALFVGGMPLTAKKLSSLFHTDHGFGFVECLLDELNRQYTEEGRPYAITLGEGGYRLSLLPEFESVRNKVFGYGPKDVKLTQDTLEVLALVAYKQPITKSQMEALGKSNAGSVLRQLLQRELIRIDRTHSPPNSKSKNDPPYVTTPRFLSLFGIGRLSDLPVAEDFAFK